MNLLQYTNGFGHLIMSVLLAGIGLALILTGHEAFGWPILSIVAAAWFVPGAARQVAHEVTAKVTSTLEDSGDKTE